VRKSRIEQREKQIYDGVNYHSFTDAFTVVGIYDEGRAPKLFLTLDAALSARDAALATRYETQNSFRGIRD
jgi:hypothetical protein